jgi:hypothetical protein
MIVWGGLLPGIDGVHLATGGRYNPTSNTWSSTTTSGAPVARKYHTAVWTGTEMIVWGGDDGDDELNTGGRYAPSTGSWTNTTVVGAPTARVNHHAVWTGTEMIVWGGWPPGSGGRLLPP